MLPRALAMWPQGQLDGIVIVLVVATCVCVCVCVIGGRVCNLRFTISVVAIWGEACSHIRTQFVAPAPPKCFFPPCQRGHTLTSSFGMTIHQPKQRGRWHTCKDVDTHLFCTWLNVTVRHVLICWRYRLNDGRVVTFTQARELTQALRGAKGDEDGWYVYGETLSCAFVMEMWRNRLAFPQHLSWLCATPSLSSSLILRVR